MARWLILLGILALFVGCALAEQTKASPLIDKTINASKIIEDINNKYVKSVNYHDRTIKGTWDFSELKDREIKKPIEITESIIEEPLDFGPGENVTFSDNVDFTGTTFKKMVNFNKVTFKIEACFLRVQFDEAAEFRRTQFDNVTTFAQAQFKNFAMFDDSHFAEDPKFDGVQFSGSASFINSRFNESATFTNAKFDTIANFCGSTFNGIANFYDDRFSTKAYFDNAKFKRLADFHKCQFNDYASFINVSISDSLSLENAQIGTIEFKNISYINCINLKGATFSRLLAHWAEIKDHIPREGLQETVYISLIRNYKNLQWLNETNDCYYDYRDWDRTHMNESGINSLVDYLDWLFNGYGVRPETPIVWSGKLIIVFAAIFSLGRTFRKKRNAPCPYISNPYETRRTEETESFISIARRFPCALLFSLTTFIPGSSYFTDAFTSLEPVGTLGKLVFEFERIIGAFFIGLIIAAITRVYITGYAILGS
jgi:hypothetical protein